MKAGFFLCRSAVTNIPQAADIKSHSFFKGVKWDQMLALGIPPPFVPDVDGPDSLKYVRPKYLEQVCTILPCSASSSCKTTRA